MVERISAIFAKVLFQNKNECCKWYMQLSRSEVVSQLPESFILLFYNKVICDTMKETKTVGRKAGGKETNFGKI
jgi:hypothetical protein